MIYVAETIAAWLFLVAVGSCALVLGVGVIGWTIATLFPHKAKP